MRIKRFTKSDPSYICYSAQIAKSLIKRSFGLTILNNFEDFDGLVIENCKIVHSFFMKNSIDLIFLDADFRIIMMQFGFKPFRISKYYKKAKYVIELPVGTIQKHQLRIRERLIFEK